MKLEVGKKYMTKSGDIVEPLRLMLVDPGQVEEPMLCVLTNDIGYQEPITYTIDGLYFPKHYGRPSQLDIESELPSAS